MNSPFIAFLKQNWKWISVSLGFLGSLLTIVGIALLIWAKSWVHETTETYLETEAANKKVSAILDKIYKNSIVASYQSHFVLSSAKNDHYIPIYVTDARDVRLFLEGAHHGAAERVKFDIFINVNSPEGWYITGQKNQQSFICQTKEKKILMGITTTPVSLTEFSDFMVRPNSAEGLGCVNAVSLSGGVTTGMMFEADGQLQSFGSTNVPLPNVITIQ